MRTWMSFCLILFSGDVLANPVSLYNSPIVFDVLRNGETVGRHETRFSHQDDRVVVDSRMQMTVSFLSVPIYSFNYWAVETWRDGYLEKLRSEVVDGNERTEIDANYDGERLVIRTSGSVQTFDGPAISTNHWNVAAVNQDKVLNTLTGNVNRVTITPMGQEKLSLPGGSVRASRYDYSGELTDTSVWYDAAGRWVKLRFKARDGSIIEYSCISCRPSP